MSIANKLADYRNKILAAPQERSESVLGKIADSFEDDLLDFDGFPDDYFEFVLNLLSDKNFYSKKGIWNFFLVLGTEGGKLLTNHYERLAESIVRNYRNYEDEDLCLAACDFIARNYKESLARNLLVNLRNIEKDKDVQLHGFANDGLLTLDREIARSRGAH